ncbi:MAG: hypothetical protein J6W82_06270 [Bacteroidales bacterium]|nr:hypothetical protein [Bacteroidales bacterium]
MKKISILSGIVAIIALAASCETKVEIQDNPVAPQGEKVTITADLSAALTRVTFTPGTDGSSKPILELTWKSGDKLRVADHADNSSYSDFDLDGASVGQKQGIFTGTPVSASSYDVWVVNEAIDFADQAQPADADPSGLQYNASVKDITDLSNIAFTDVSSVLMFTAKNLPAGVAATIKSMDIKAFNSEGTACNIFDGDNSLKVTLAAAGDEGSDNNLVFYASLPKGSTDIPAGTSMLVKFNATSGDQDVYTRYFTISSAVSLTAGKLNEISVGCANVKTHAGAATCDGSNAAKAYLIGDKYQMQAMSSLLVADAVKYFTMVDDVDLDGVAWTSLNNSGSFEKGIYFDGAGHTIDHLTSSTGSYPSFVGVVNGTVKDVTFDHAAITAGNNTAGVLAGYVGSSSTSRTGNISGITVKNSFVKGATKTRVGGIAGIVNVAGSTISNCHVNIVTLTSTNERVGGLFGEVDSGITVDNCSALSVTAEGSINIGGLIGVNYGNVTNCTSSGSLSSCNTTSNYDICIGGLVGYFDGASSTISKCSSSVSINQTKNGRDIGGFVGKMLAGTIEKCYCTGNVSGIQRNVGGFVGLISLTSSTATIRNCYCSGTVTANSYNGGFLGLHEKGTALITNCFSTSNVSATGGFAAGGMAGVTGSADFTMSYCAAWNGTITPKSYGSGNWSSAAVVGVTFPKCTLTDNYRNPDMSLTAYWVPAADYNHPNVSSEHPLVKQDGTETTATATSSGQDGYPQFPYHGKVEAGKTLSQLASTTLGWSGEVWDFTGSIPTLK